MSILDGAIFFTGLVAFMVGNSWHPMAGVALAAATVVPMLIATLLWRMLAHILSTLLRIETLLREQKP